MKNLLDELVIAAGEQKLNVRNVIVRRDNEVIAQHSFVPDTPQLLWSVSKTFTSMAIGLAAAEGYFSLTDKVTDLYAEYIPSSPSTYLQTMRLRDLLCMGTGHDKDPGQFDCEYASYPDPTAAAFFHTRLTDAPGTHFTYNNAASYMLSLLIGNKTQANLLDYLMPRVFTPLGIPKPIWERTPKGIPQGYSGLHLSAEQLSLFGQLILDRGMWKGKQLIPSDYIDQACAVQIDNSDFDADFATADHHQGYGYQMWRNSYPDSFRMDGYLGQYVILLPKKNTLVTYTSDEHEKMTDIIELTWDHLVDKL